MLPKKIETAIQSCTFADDTYKNLPKHGALAGLFYREWRKIYIFATTNYHQYTRQLYWRILNPEMKPRLNQYIRRYQSHPNDWDLHTYYEYPTIMSELPDPSDRRAFFDAEVNDMIARIPITNDLYKVLNVQPRPEPIDPDRPPITKRGKQLGKLKPIGVCRGVLWEVYFRRAKINSNLQNPSNASIEELQDRWRKGNPNEPVPLVTSSGVPRVIFNNEGE